MIQKVRRKFIMLSTACLAIVLIFCLGLLVIVNFNQATRERNRVMDILVTNNGQLTPSNSGKVVGNRNNPLSRNFSPGQGNPESVYQYRYFTVMDVNGDGKNLQVMKGQKNYRLSTKQKKQAAQEVLEKNRRNNQIRLAGSFYKYEIVTNPDGQRMVIFLNTSLIYARSWYLLRVSTLLGAGTLVIFALILGFLSNKAIKPIAAAYKKQREFITNAGHELKTPLAIISANTEMEEMLGNKSEWTESTKQQTKRLTDLINQLISMSRIGEHGDLVLAKVNFSELTEENSKSFSSMMKSDNLDYQINIQPNLSVMAEKRSLGEVVNILLDNAHKYCLENGKVVVDLHRSTLNRNVILKVSNSFKNDKKIDYNHFFERFYREDESHNNKKSGFGIGLSMAKDIVTAFNGKIDVNYDNNTQMISFIVTLKIAK